MGEAATVDLDPALRDILMTAIRRNHAVEITGILIAHDGWFIQALEGPKPAVEEAYARIARDSRHLTPVVLTVEDSTSRAFERWSMCASTLSDVDHAILEQLGLRASFDPLTCPERWVMRLLSAVAEVHERTLDRQCVDIETLPGV